MADAYRENSSGANEELIFQNAHARLKDQPMINDCDQLLEASSKRLMINDLSGYSDSSTPRTPSRFSTPSTPINVDSDDTPTTEIGGIIRPIGRKSVKRKKGKGNG